MGCLCKSPPPPPRRVLHVGGVGPCVELACHQAGVLLHSSAQKSQSLPGAAESAQTPAGKCSHGPPPASWQSLLPGRLVSVRAPHSQLLLSPECLTQFLSTRWTLQVPLNFHLSCQAHAEFPGLVCPVSKLLECSVSHGVVPVHRHLLIPVVSRVCILPSSESSLIVTRTFGGCSRATLTLNQSSGGLSGR